MLDILSVSMVRFLIRDNYGYFGGGITPRACGISPLSSLGGV